MLKYDEIRCTATSNYPVRELVKSRRAEMDAAASSIPRSGTALPPSGRLSGALQVPMGYPQVRKPR